MTEQITPRLLGLVEVMPDGDAIIGWNNLARAMRYSTRQAKRVAETDPTFPKRKHRGRVYVLVTEFMAWYSGQVVTARA